MNTVLLVGEPLGPRYYEWRSLVRKMPGLLVGQLIRRTTPQLTDQEVAAYDAPFLTADSRREHGPFRELAMVEPEVEGGTEAKEALRFWKEERTGQSFMAIGGKAPEAETMHTLRSQIHGCPAPLVLPDADHFVPEWGGQVVRAALRSYW